MPQLQDGSIASKPIRYAASRINLRDRRVAQAGIVVAGVDDRDILRDRVEQVLRKLGYRWEGDRYDNDVDIPDNSTTPRVSTAVAPISSAKALTPSGPLEFATRTSCPAALNLRARVPPILPVPMIPIFIACNLPICLLLLLLLSAMNSPARAAAHCLGTAAGFTLNQIE